MDYPNLKSQLYQMRIGFILTDPLEPLKVFMSLPPLLSRFAYTTLVFCQCEVVIDPFFFYVVGMLAFDSKGVPETG